MDYKKYVPYIAPVFGENIERIPVFDVVLTGKYYSIDVKPKNDDLQFGP